MKIVEVLKASVGPILAILLAWLAYSIITGNVTERNSYGLDGVFAIIGALGTAYGLHYFAPRSGNGAQK